MTHVEERVRGLQIRLLGRLEVLRGGVAVPLPASKKSRALLGYLVATARPHLRERLCELLWEAPDDPRASLRWCLAKIRPLVDDPDGIRLASDRDEIAFHPAGADVDLTAVRAVLSGGAAVASMTALRRAAGLFRGEFLEGLDLTGCYRYHEWWIGERERTRALWIAVLNQLVQRLHGSPEEALEHARQLLSLDPLSEAAHAQLIRLLGAMGRTREAVAQYERCKRILAAELGREPSPELTLARLNLANAPKPTTLPPAPMPAPATDTPAPSRRTLPLVGRERELAALGALVSQTAQGADHAALQIFGEPGIGKTRLLEELSQLVIAAGGVVLSGRAFETETVRPYGAWIDALRSVPLPPLPADVRTDLLPLLPELGAKAPGAGDRNRLFDAVTHLLATSAPANAPALVLLDDIHWFDEASAALLHFAVRALARSRVLFAWGARRAELYDNPVALRLLRSLLRERRLLEIELTALGAKETLELVTSLTTNVDAGRVFRESEGNPFFALEIARVLAAGEDSVAKNLDQLIGDRFDRLGKEASQLLPWAAALGRSFRCDLLGDVVPLMPAQLITGIEELERREILRGVRAADGTPSYDFSHDLIRQAAYQRASEARQRLLHLEIARALSKLDDRPGLEPARGGPTGILAADIAHHAALGGDDELCVRACITAGNRCIRIFANLEAQSLADRGRQRLERLPGAVRIPLHIALLRVSIESGGWRLRVGEIEGELARTVIEAQSAGLHAEVAAGWELLSELHEEQGDVARAEASMTRSEQASREADPETQARTIARAGRCLAQLEKEMPKARGLLEEAVTLSMPLRLELPDIPLGLGLLRHQEGDSGVAERLLEQGWKLAARKLDHWLAYESLSRLIMLLLENGNAEAALERCSDLEPLAAKLGEGSELPFASTLKALAKLSLGSTEARDEVEGALTKLREIDTKGQLAYALNFVAGLEWDAGDWASAQKRAVQALQAAEGVGRRTEVARSRVLLARSAVRAGDSASARQHLEAVQGDLKRPLGLAASVRQAVVALLAKLDGGTPSAPNAENSTASLARRARKSKVSS